MNVPSRRQFLIALAAGLTGLTCAGVGLVTRRRRCPACGVLSRGHRYTERGRTGLYCPNCAFELTRRRWDVQPYRLAGSGVPAGALETSGIPEVPFPHPRLTGPTNKPLAVLSDIRFSRS